MLDPDMLPILSDAVHYDRGELTTLRVTGYYCASTRQRILLGQSWITKYSRDGVSQPHPLVTYQQARKANLGLPSVPDPTIGLNIWVFPRFLGISVFPGTHSRYSLPPGT